MPNRRIKIHTEKKRFRKYMTVVEGLTGEELDRTAKELKRILACGGTSKNGVIELQGNHKDNVRKALHEIRGFAPYKPFSRAGSSAAS